MRLIPVSMLGQGWLDGKLPVPFPEGVMFETRFRQESVVYVVLVKSDVKVEMPSAWCGAEIRKRETTRIHPRHLNLVSNYVVRPKVVLVFR
ncbi:hypothetical protein AVEN_70231-1 [Araneus ventricosus]|uniref:Uncharacterized protein n=1 Tax=Araneus ventricosus TaxID=182803 RepID=A0A4Y2G9U0_ARAVE|nr:hypothetical protein AVEN_70231-1 [Araneus ventricosus]